MTILFQKAAPSPYNNKSPGCTLRSSPEMLAVQPVLFLQFEAQSHTIVTGRYGVEYR